MLHVIPASSDSFNRFDNCSGNKLLHYFIRASIDTLNSSVNKGPCYTSIHHVAPSTMKLKTLGCHLTLQISGPVLKRILLLINQRGILYSINIVFNS